MVNTKLGFLTNYFIFFMQDPPLKFRQISITSEKTGYFSGKC